VRAIICRIADLRSVAVQAVVRTVVVVGRVQAAVADDTGIVRTIDPVIAVAVDETPDASVAQFVTHERRARVTGMNRARPVQAGIRTIAEYPVVT
jgi:hypothetical protein